MVESMYDGRNTQNRRVELLETRRVLVHMVDRYCDREIAGLVIDLISEYYDAKIEVLNEQEHGCAPEHAGSCGGRLAVCDLQQESH